MTKFTERTVKSKEWSIISRKDIEFDLLQKNRKA